MWTGRKKFISRKRNPRKKKRMERKNAKLFNEGGKEIRKKEMRKRS